MGKGAQLIVTRNPAAVDLLEFHVKISRDLQSWHGDSGNVTLVEDSPTLLRVRDVNPASAHSKGYMVLEIEVKP